MKLRSRERLLLLLLPAAIGAGIAAAAVPARAGEPLRLADAVRIARERSPMILEAKANRDAAGAGRREAWLALLPSVTIRQMAIRTDSPADAFGLQLMQERFSFPEFVGSDPNDPDEVTNYATEFQATMPVFTGGELSGGIAQAGRMAAAADAAAAHTESAVSLKVAEAYMGVLLADRFVELAVKAYDTTAKHVDQAQAYFDAGMMVESDLLQARVHLAKMEEGKITAQNNARLARAGLNRVMGVDLDRDFDLAADGAAELPPVNDLQAALVSARERRQDLRAAAAQAEAAGLGVRRAFGEYIPDIAVGAKYALNDDKLFGDHGTSTTLMAMAQWNVWNWGQTHARVSRAKSQRTAAEESLRAYEQQVEFEVLQAWLGVGDARARLNVAAEAVARAERAMAILEDRFGQGIARVTDLLDAETMLNDARARDLNARFDLDRSIRTLNHAIGLAPVPEV